MYKVIKKIPIPIAGLMLALGATGNLLKSYGSIYRNFSGILSAIILFLLIGKITTNFNSVKEDLKNPVIASVFPTFSMGVMIMATYIKSFLPIVAYGVWVAGLIIHLLLIVYFTKNFIVRFNIKKVFPSYFVVYVGIVVGSVTAPTFQMQFLGQYLFWFGFISYLILLPIILYRVYKVKEIPEPALPTITIFAAPASLCLAGYMSSFQEKNMIIVGLLTTLSLVMISGVLFYLPKMLKIKFYPSYSAFTFPLVISAIAIKLTNAFFIKSNLNISFLKYIVLIEEFIAISIVLYVLLRYTYFLISISQDSKKATFVK